mmetsp:Transcript_35823/g.65195  ORF Transcript_35823/g.65195 Transcript_35823/m.65195 type:complete len:389 (+) Transcript_35823:130-1296(+)|eukprot:CAMPEP_0194578034 /NCGR_PEP_ID=MMETSP0292-20121207/12594_1 /TAXON_ID=39354 /ORGANISM="Heterosigma akashiwo, Strain CCMP2393" /LENGTH=388 /DNA_ID=CAMNT_0039430569 /DNA_START=141 /DNA_END=1307 /DNA_ORIENTATION=+
MNPSKLIVSLLVFCAVLCSVSAGISGSQSSNTGLRRSYTALFQTRGGAIAVKSKPVQLKPSAAKVDGQVASAAKTASPLKVVGLFGLWYFFTICSSSAMTSASKAMPLPWAGTAMRLWVGSAFIMALWKTGIKPEPVVTKETIKSVSPVSAMSTLTLLLTGMAYAAGSLPFVSIVKSAEPATMALINAVFFGKLLPAPVYASLIPVIGGVGLASLKELNFSALCLILSMMVNVTSSLRSIMAKGLTNTGLKPSALTGLNSILGAMMITPIALVLEGAKLLDIYRKVASGDAGMTAQLKRFLVLNCVSGICLFLFYEGNFMCLNAVGPLSHSIGSTIGRVVVIAAGVLIYRTKMTPLNVLGAALAVGGVFLYSYMQNLYAARAAADKAK